MPAPSSLTAPSLSGTQEVGYTISCTSGTWSHGVDSYVYQWQEQKPGEHPYADIAGATANSYLILAGDQEHIIRCKVTATNSSGSTIAYSDATAAIPNDLLIVEDGTGKTDSNSYVDLAYVNAYFAVRNNATWAGYSIGERKAAIIKGAAYADKYDFIGTKKTANQAMQWPRINAKVDGYLLDSTVIPKALKDAQCEAALRAAAGEIMADIESGSTIEETVDLITVKYSEYSSTGVTRYPAIESLLRKLITSSGNYHRVVRT